MDIKVVKAKSAHLIRLWLEGKGAWNDYMEKTPEEVDFRGIDFSDEMLTKNYSEDARVAVLLSERTSITEVSFKGYIFPKKASFHRAKFPGSLSIDKATFKDDCELGEIEVSGSLMIGSTTFEESFKLDHASIGGDVEIQGCVFNKALECSGGSFSGDFNIRNCSVYRISSFQNSKFSESFELSGCTFRGAIQFRTMDVKGAFSVYHSAFNSSLVFRGSRFHKDVVFFSCDFEGVSASFKKCRFESSFELILRENKRNFQKLLFNGAHFKLDVNVSALLACVPDFRQTKIDHHFDVEHLKVQLNRKKNDGAILESAIDPEDAERFCRLKEIADSNKNHDKALLFLADEMRARRWNSISTFESILDGFYSLASNYGQSVKRPVILLMFNIFLFAQFTCSYGEREARGKFESALVVSVATITPFMAISREARKSSLDKIFNNGVPERYYLYSYLYSFSAFILIFLVGLGLRNRFRI
ncbi:hypothetical protein [Pseudoalteromonas luteoviolacea]|uniref:Pentapeptide repeat-containing protein n=1 Tax=Pseudoalteromonas luteoviolacea H33 TaxID=1365251 RepID=A0A167E1L1_9GAMM|nr:hypothetical protein [Pseudoalteromonas luteoviolacea]KZN49886.1 hypothetical protein N476_17935 [Pseudoalteromonas luteoviolacea H33]KZN74800.1 hypothetical protein N477_21350 [Pseudoalteromonas luteoviolacea H33-S]